MRLNREVFPAPFGPIIAVMELGPNLKVTLLTARTPAKLIETDSSFSIHCLLEERMRRALPASKVDSPLFP